MSDLSEKKCGPCQGGTPPLTRAEAEKLLPQVFGWSLGNVLGENFIFREFQFKSFKEATLFVNRVAELAEQEGHHPDFDIRYKKVKLALTTHAINGLSENDFILAAKINRL